jgi:hypothetical protein
MKLLTHSRFRRILRAARVVLGLVLLVLEIIQKILDLFQ